MQNSAIVTPLPAEFLRIQVAAKFIGMSPAFLRKEARLKRGPERVRCGKCLLYHIDSLREYMASRTEKTV